MGLFTFAPAWQNGIDFSQVLYPNWYQVGWKYLKTKPALSSPAGSTLRLQLLREVNDIIFLNCPKALILSTPYSFEYLT